jgi:X-X-X-Leu-X-X-Gly heptad repeat protein
VMGPGWATPYNVIVVSNTRPLTTPALLARLDRFEVQVAKDSRVEAVTGPGAISSTSSQLSSFGPQLKHSAKVSDKSKTQLLQLIDGLGQAGTGSAQLQTRLAQASSGAQQLHGGSGRAQTGATQLHAGLAQAGSGSRQLRSTTSLFDVERPCSRRFFKPLRDWRSKTAESAAGRYPSLRSATGSRSARCRWPVRGEGFVSPGCGW